mmetsp:Transcript_24338/g.45028  ORF Transcript_24338/g.45028 Transcript_24338/m.45028 type:complete len:203 (-) Transcript_24338:126-734(-)
MHVPPATLPTFTTELVAGTSPSPSSVISFVRFKKGWHIFVSSNMLTKFVRRMNSSSPSLYSTVFLRMFVPTLFTNISNLPSGPKISFNFSTKARRPSGVETSATTPRTSMPFPRHSSSRSVSSSSLREQVRMVHPKEDESSSTMALPMPFVPPVTRAVVPEGRDQPLLLLVGTVAAPLVAAAISPDEGRETKRAIARRQRMV